MPPRHTLTLTTTLALTALGWLAPLRAAAFPDPWADQVISYSSGSNPEADYVADANVVLGSPERISGENTPFGSFPGGVTMFSPAYGIDEIISIGAGGELVVRFDEPITNDPSHLHGVDLIVFGNSFFTLDTATFSTITGVGAEPGTIEVSQDGLTWHAVSTFADTLFPTQGYLDADIFGDPPGSVPTDFLRPVNPNLNLSDFLGKSYAEALALYDGSGGGAPVDIGPTGLSSVSYLRISVPVGSAWSTEIDAFAAVPEPAAVTMLLLGTILVWRRKR